MKSPPLLRIAPGLLALCPLAATASGQDAPATSTPPDGTLAERVLRLESELAAMRQEQGFRIGSDFTADIYGYVKLDAAHDEARTSVGNFARWVETEGLNPNDSEFSMTARQTRLGLRVKHPPAKDLQALFRVEVDFYGQGGGENRAAPMLRHAYVDLSWPSGWSLLFGQTSDVISPLWLPTVNYTVGWWQGNIGYRRPQVRLTRKTYVKPGHELALALAATATIASRTNEFAPDDGDTGRDAGFPTVQSRIGWTFPLVSEEPASLGVSGHYGAEEYDTDAKGSDEEFSSWSLNLDADVPLCRWARLQGELYTGENLDTYLGGIAQGFDPLREDTVAAAGGWVAAMLSVRPDVDVYLGWALDTAESDDLSSASARTRNQVAFVNARRRWGDHFQVALEVSYLETEYRDLASGNGLRTQLALIYGL